MANSTDTKVRKRNKRLANASQRQEEVYQAIAKFMMKRRSGIITLEQIASQLGGSRGTIYYYFKSRADMLYQMQNYLLDNILADIEPIFNELDLPPRERLDKYIRTLVLSCCKQSDIMHALWDGLHVRELPPRLQRPLLRKMRKSVEQLDEMLTEIIKDEKIKHINANITARTITGMINSYFMWYDPKGVFTPDQLCENTSKIVFEGVLSRKQPHE